MSNTVNPLAQLVVAAQPQSTQPKRSGNFFEALSQAWASALDRQAETIQQKATTVADGGDKISDITLLTAEASKFSFMASSSNTSMSESAKALETVARKG